MSENRNETIKIFDSIYRYIGYCRSEQLAKSSADREIADYPAAIDTWFASYSSNLKRKQRAREFIYTGLPKLAVTAILVFVVLGITTFSVDALRVKFLNFIINRNDVYTEVHIDEGSTNKAASIPSSWNSYYIPGYVPDTYYLDSVQEAGTIRILMYRDTEKNELLFTQGDINSDLHIDTESATVEELTINGRKALFVNKSDRITIVWYTDDAVLCAIGTITREEMMRFVESIIFTEP